MQNSAKCIHAAIPDKSWGHGDKTQDIDMPQEVRLEYGTHEEFPAQDYSSG